MLHIYENNATSFTNMGLAIVHPLSANIKQKINNLQTLDFTIPINEHIKQDRIIKADGQLYRILRIETIGEDKEYYNVNCENIFTTDMIDDYVETLFLSDVSVSTILTDILDGTIYQVGVCDDFGLVSISVANRNKSSIISQLLNQVSGELDIDGTVISIKESIGKSTNTKINYRENLKGIKYIEDHSNVITRLHYQAKENPALNGSVDSPNISDYSKPKIAYREFERLTQNGLNSAAQNFLSKNDKYYFNYQINMIELSRTEDYKDYVDVEHLSLGDMVIVKHDSLDIDVQARVIEMQRDIIHNNNTSVVLGNFRENYFDFNASVVNTKSLVDYAFTDRKLNSATLKGITIINENTDTVSFEVTEDGAVIVEKSLTADSIFAENIDTTNAKITNAQIENITANQILIGGENGSISFNDLSDIPDLPEGYTDEDAINAINSTYIDANGVWTPQVYAQNIVTSTAKITTAQIENLIVGSNVTMGASATISWSQVTSKPYIPELPSYIQSTKITSTTIESPSITGGTVTGGSILGGTIAIGSGNSIFKADSNGMYLGNATFASSPFKVDMSGNLTATNSTITGTINTSSGSFGGNITSTATITGGTIQTAGTNNARIILSGNGIESRNASNQYHGLNILLDGSHSDLRLYRNGSLRLNFQDDIDQYAIRYGTTELARCNETDFRPLGTWNFTSAILTGGVKKTYVQSTAPSDTNGIWIDTN